MCEESDVNTWLDSELDGVLMESDLNETSKTLLQAAKIAQRGNYVEAAELLQKQASPEIAYAFAGLVNSAAGGEVVHRPDVGLRSPEVRYDAENAQIIAIEGGDNVGKTSLIQIIREMLHSKFGIGISLLFEVGIDAVYQWISADPENQNPTANVLITKEPGGSRIGVSIRKVLLETTGLSNRLDPFVYTLLYYADRAQNYAEVDRFLKRYPDGMALLDRCSLSTLVFQVNDFRRKCEAKGFCGEELERRVASFRESMENFDKSFHGWNSRVLGRNFPETLILLDGDTEELAYRTESCAGSNGVARNWRDEDSIETQRRLRAEYLRLVAKRGGFVCNAHGLILENAFGIVDFISGKLKKQLCEICDITKEAWLWGPKSRAWEGQMSYLRRRISMKDKPSLAEVDAKVKASWMAAGISDAYEIRSGSLTGEAVEQLGIQDLMEALNREP